MVTSTGRNYEDKSTWDEVLEAWFTNYAGRTSASDPDEIPIYRHGVMWSCTREMTRQEMDRIKYEMAPQLAALSPPTSPDGPDPWAFHIVDEGYFLSVRVSLGSYERPTSMTDAIEEMRAHKGRIREVHQFLWDCFDEMDWVVFADIDSEWLYE